MTYKGWTVDYQGQCPCSEASLYNCTKGHDPGRKTIVRTKYGNLLAICPNHLHNYLGSPQNSFEYVGLEETK